MRSRWQKAERLTDRARATDHPAKLREHDRFRAFSVLPFPSRRRDFDLGIGAE